MEVRPIDANVAEIKLIEILASAMAKRKTVYDASDALIEVVRSKTPTLDYAPVIHSNWREPWPYHTGAICRNCDTRAARKHNYCPFCWAKMNGKVGC